MARTSDGRSFVVDPDYGFVLAGTLDEVASRPDRVIAATIAAGHSPRIAANVARIYGPEGNIEFWNGDRGYRPIGYWIERIAYWLKWIVPIALMIIGLREVFEAALKLYREAMTKFS